MYKRPIGLFAASILASGILTAPAANAATTLSWETVVNNTMTFPGDTRSFNSYNQPSVNNAGLVVFRARTQGGGGIGQPATGILTRDMSTPGNAIVPLAVRGSAVPQPNNTAATFNEFPSIPRIDATSSMIATRGQSQPVLEYQTGIDPTAGGPITTKGGTAGIYANPNGALATGAAGLGNVSSTPFGANPDLTHFQVPNAAPLAKFDQFPGAPSPTGGDIVFKGNWTEGATGQTGVYFRDMNANGGASPVQLIADSKTEIPGFAGTTFGSTAPPSAANGRAVFLGLDNEDAPTKGGLYMANLDNTKAPGAGSLLTTIATIGGNVLNQANKVFTQIGEALSFDGTHVAYWGALGKKDSNGKVLEQTRSVTVSCGSIENANTSSFCNAQDNGLTAGSGTAGDGLYSFNVAVDQGFFITDVNTLETRMVAETGSEFQDFVNWNFSGQIPGQEGEDDGEFARWRSASFIASDGWNAAFKGSLLDGNAGLYGLFNGELSTIAQLGMDGGLLDPAANGLAITSLGVERDGYRNGRLVINASMTDGVNSMAGIYIAGIPEPATWATMILGFGFAGSVLRRRRRPVAI